MRIDPRGDPDLEPLATSFNRTAEALEQRVRADARFAGDVSHELRSPLTAMLTAADLLDNYRTTLPHGGREALDMLCTEVDRFNGLVTDLLEISRSDTGGADVAFEDVRVAELVRRCLHAEHRALLRVMPPADDIVTRVGKRRLERVVSDLVENADRHGRGLRAVTVDTADGCVRLLVDDAGPGVAPSDRARIFERAPRCTRGARRRQRHRARPGPGKPAPAADGRLDRGIGEPPRRRALHRAASRGARVTANRWAGRPCCWRSRSR